MGPVLCGVLVDRNHHVGTVERCGEDRAREFFVNILGMTELAKPPVLAARGGCWFAEGAVQVHLGVDDDLRPARKAHVALAIDDATRLITRLRDAGYDVREGDEVNGRMQRYTDDPFGNRIELIG